MNGNIPRLRDWAYNLVSGKYTQIQKRLRTINGFCCLGVACDLYAQASGRHTQWRIFTLDLVPVDPSDLVPINPEQYKFGFEGSLPPAAVLEWFEMHINDIPAHLYNLDRSKYEKYYAETLAYLNDNGASFREIAQLIDDYCDEIEARQ